jgi:hypothetical protein
MPVSGCFLSAFGRPLVYRGYTVLVAVGLPAVVRLRLVCVVWRRCTLACLFVRFRFIVSSLAYLTKKQRQLLFRVDDAVLDSQR